MLFFRNTAYNRRRISVSTSIDVVFYVVILLFAKKVKNKVEVVSMTALILEELGYPSLNLNCAQDFYL